MAPTRGPGRRRGRAGWARVRGGDRVAEAVVEAMDVAGVVEVVPHADSATVPTASTSATPVAGRVRTRRSVARAPVPRVAPGGDVAQLGSRDPPNRMCAIS